MVLLFLTNGILDHDNNGIDGENHVGCLNLGVKEPNVPSQRSLQNLGVGGDEVIFFKMTHPYTDELERNTW